MTIAILMTCFNRVETTLCCLKHLFACERPEGVVFDVYLVDDGSPDRTGDIVKKNYSPVKVIEGTGNLFWCGGMRLAWDTAAKTKDYDGYLWLNDDTFLNKDALRCVLESASLHENISIIVGALCDPVTKQVTYGFSGNPTRNPDGTLSPIRREESINGNVVYVSRCVWKKIGGLRTCFVHAMGDTDYGFRARKAGIEIFLTPHYVGDCKTNCGPSWFDQHSFIQRWHLLHSSKGCPPWQFMRVLQVYHPYLWPFHIAHLYWRVFFRKNKK